MPMRIALQRFRSQVDRVTSRQLLDQQLMEEKVAELIARQNALSNRHGRLGPLLNRAGLKPENIPVPIAKPKQQAANSGAPTKSPRLAGMASRPEILSDPKTARINPLAYAVSAQPAGQESVSDRADRIFSTVTLSLKSIEREQIEKMQVLAVDAYETASEIGAIITDAGLPLPEDANSAVGGPFVLPSDPESFRSHTG
jgi:hypothetical protein